MERRRPLTVAAALQTELQLEKYLFGIPIRIQASPLADIQPNNNKGCRNRGIMTQQWTCRYFHFVRWSRLEAQSNSKFCGWSNFSGVRASLLPPFPHQSTPSNKYEKRLLRSSPTIKTPSSKRASFGPPVQDNVFRTFPSRPSSGGNRSKKSKARRPQKITRRKNTKSFSYRQTILGTPSLPCNEASKWCD
jgi:hypothetical protein